MFYPRANIPPRLRTRSGYFAEHALKLRSKIGPLEPFILNDAQRKLHGLIEEQKAKTGRVRVVVLKARQLGITSYVAARYFHRTVHRPGLRTFILGHERRARAQIFFKSSNASTITSTRKRDPRSVRLTLKSFYSRA